MMPVDDIVSAYEFLSEQFPEGRNIENPDHAPIDADPGIRPTWWWPGWIPFMENGGGDYLCIDMDPAPGGTLGQVVAYYHDETFRIRRAGNIGHLFARIADGLESGTYILNLDSHMIVERY
ncbi:SMI1/KNR4 family protein [Brucella endophytica]|uniref:SMI1/KNR4 family protein n=1 Tax=Brucella endophytica TaxID=1963359 RepID=UPI00166B20AF